MKVFKVDKKVKIGKEKVIKYQLLTFCFLNDIQVSNSDLSFLTELARFNNHELTSFCKYISDKKIFKSPQSVRNAVTKAEKKNLIVKNGVNKKNIKVNPKIKVQTKGTILLDYKILGVESQEV